MVRTGAGRGRRGRWLPSAVPVGLPSAVPVGLLAAVTASCALSAGLFRLAPGATAPRHSFGVGPIDRAAAGAPPERARWTVTGLGDSVTAGSACDCDDFVQEYAGLARDRTGRPVDELNLGVPGQTSADLVDLVRQPIPARQLAGSDIVLVTIGANDLGDELADWQNGRCELACFERAMPEITANVAEVIGEIRRLRAGRPTEILVTDYWNVFVDGATGAALGTRYQNLSDRVTRLANDAICTGATRAGAACIDLYVPFKGDGSADPTELLADDGDHPDAAGHRAIAAALAAHGWNELGLRPPGHGGGTSRDSG